MTSANSQRTKKFLQLVAQRLSSRADCKQVQFIVDIGVTKSNCVMFKFNPGASYMMFKKLKIQRM